MDRTIFWIVVLSLAVGTVMIRSSILFLYTHIRIPKKLKDAFPMGSAAVLPALAAPAVFLHKGQVLWLGGAERIIALVIAALICLKTKNLSITLITGMLALYILKML